MLAPAPIDMYAAIERLKHDPDFEKVLGWLRSSRDITVDEVLNHSQTNLIFQAQGEARALDDVLRTFESARAALERHSSSGAMNT